MVSIGRITISRARTLALAAFLASLGVNWPELPLNIRLPDLLFIPVVALLVTAPGRRPSLTLLDLLAILYLAGGLPSFSATTDFRSSLVELVRHGYVVAIYAAVAVAVHRAYVASVMTGMAASGLGPALVGVVFAAAYAFRPFEARLIGDVTALPYAGPVLRLRALTATPAMLACVLTMAFPFAIAGAVRAPRSGARRFWMAGLALMAVAAVMTFSQVIAGFAVAALVAAWPLLHGRPMSRRAAAIAVSAVVVICNLSVIASVRQVSLDDRIVSDSTQYHYAVDEGRVRLGGVQVVYEVISYFRLKELAWEAFRAHPLTGVGLDRFHDVTERAYREGRLPARYRAADPHSAMLGRLAETGLAGGVTLALLWAGLVVTGLRVLRERDRDTWPARAAFAGLLGLLVAGINVDIMNFRFFWAGLGLLRGWMSTTDDWQTTG
jgi:hypothetical protein